MPPVQKNSKSKTMKAIVLKKIVGKYSEGKEMLQECLEVQEVPKPVPKFNQVLIKIQRAQINPSDTSFIQNRYGKKAEIGVIPGFEGCGTVVGHGGSLVAWRLMKKRVSFFAQQTWAEYVVVDALNCFVLGNNVQWQNAAGAIANPVTVMIMLDYCRKEKMVVATAGTSGLTSQFIRAAKSKGIKTIAIVRKEEQIQICQDNGAFATLNSEAEDFSERLTALCTEHKVKVAFDSVAGEVGSKVLAALAPKGEIFVYGFLSGKPLTIAGSDLIFKQKFVRGLWLSAVYKFPITKLLRIKKEVVSLLETDLKTVVQATFPMDQVVDALIKYTGDLSAGKVQLIIGDAETS